MTRPTLAAALATAALALVSFEAAAAPGAVTSFTKTYTLQCSAGQWDGNALKANRTIIKNTTGRAIPQGAKISIRYFMPYGFAVTREAYRMVGINDTIAFDDFGRAKFCVASVTLPRIDTKIIMKKPLGR
jgi:hypothetical protein